ncbi:MAG: hypothetical protein ACOVSS_10740, partial [Bacteroidia bacterium]
QGKGSGENTEQLFLCETPNAPDSKEVIPHQKEKRHCEHGGKQVFPAFPECHLSVEAEQQREKKGADIKPEIGQMHGRSKNKNRGLCPLFAET